MSLVTTLALAAQRLNIRLPHGIRQTLRSRLVKLTQRHIVESRPRDWTIPLIERSDAPVNGHLAVATNGLAAALPAFSAPDLDAPPWNTPHPRHSRPAPQLRCLLVTPSLDAGGMDEVVVFLARRLPRHGVRTAVLHASHRGTRTGAPSGRLGQRLRDEGIETVELDDVQGRRWLQLWRPDVIGAHDAPAWVLEAATEFSLPYVDTLHGMHSLFSRSSDAEISRAARVTAIVAVSDLVRRQYLALNPCFGPAQIVTIPNGVDHWRRAPRDRAQARALFRLGTEFLFVSLARYCLQKNSYGLLAAFADVAAQYPEAHLVIAGRCDDAPYFGQVMRLRAQLPCSNRIHLRDHTPDVPQLLAAADAFVLDSFFEGWPLASMEALYAGVPVILTDVGGAHEQVGEGEHRGYVVPNPIGDPLRVNWDTIRRARYARQTNRRALVGAMIGLINTRRDRLALRRQLMLESAKRFHPDTCLRAHAHVLRAAATGEAPRVD